MNFLDRNRHGLSCRLLLGLAMVLKSTGLVQAGDVEKEFRTKVAAFVASLDAGQRKACVLPFDHKDRWQIQYTGGKREGVQIKTLNQGQRKRMEEALRMVLSDKGWEMANKVAAQDGEQGLGKYYLACFGDPGGKGKFAFRLAEHHLTIVHLEVAEGETTEFGPVLLGANPPNLWKEDEVALMKAFKTIRKEGVLIPNRSGIASKSMPEGEGVPFAQLGDKAKAAIQKAWQGRLSIFQPAFQKRINKLHKARGGWEKSRVAFYNQAPEKRCTDGGRWDFKCGLPGMVWDFESSRGHIHMSLWVK